MVRLQKFVTTRARPSRGMEFSFQPAIFQAQLRLHSFGYNPMRKDATRDARDARVMGRVDVMAISRLWVRGGRWASTRAARGRARRKTRRSARGDDDVVRRASSSSRGVVVVVVARVVVAGKRGDRPNDTLARGANARDEGGDFSPRVE